MKKVAITGAEGTIGNVLREGLKKDYEIVSIDIGGTPAVDTANYKELYEAVDGADAIIHLAWDTEKENFRSGQINPDNVQMIYNVYQIATEKGIPRVITASSVHADNFYEWKGPGLLSAQRPNQVPDSPYGASKAFMEALGKYYSKKGLEVVAVRFGGINPENVPPAEAEDRIGKYERLVWLSHGDCVDLIKKCLEEPIPGNFAAIYAVSENEGKVHDTSNPVGWAPKDSAQTFGK
ncbi:MAG: NAD(P)-dependent oxidoreductase [Candidatus Aenigmarchaeota archaeon]|nr:NAD(P)-dependent oxidoreductase [Candidatus Aenigmarchaeota archaeon]